VEKQRRWGWYGGEEQGQLVAQRYSQKEGIDYEETFALVVRLEAIRILLAFVVAKGLKLFQMDVKSVFLRLRNTPTECINFAKLCMA
jgi:hypothetical protein